MSEDLNNLFWLERFTFREEMIPNFLLKYKEKVLHTGKYLNVIRECGRDIKYTAAQFEEQKNLANLNAVDNGGDEEMQID